MMAFFYIFVGIIFLGLSIGFLWRYSQNFPCPSWLSWMVEMDNPFTKTNRAKFIIENLDLKPNMTVLDAGCGPGRLTIPIATELSNGNVTAMDIQMNMLQKVQAKAQTKNLHNIYFLNAELGSGKLEHNKYDRALLITVLGEIPNQKAALKELFQALKPGGILSITEIIFDPHFQQRGKITKLAHEIGFQETKFIGNRLAFLIHLKKPE